MRKVFFTGIMIFLPVAITLTLFIFFLDFFTTPFITLLTVSINKFVLFVPDHLLLFFVRLLVIFILFIGICTAGFLCQWVLFASLIKQIHNVLDRIPLIGILYRGMNEIIRGCFNEHQGKIFPGTVIGNFSETGGQAMGFLARPVPQSILSKNPNLEGAFIPTSPHPIAGFFLFYEKQDLQKNIFSAEDTFKFLLSAGTSVPNPIQKVEPSE